MSDTMDLPELVRFVALAEANSFRRAAQRLGITQPTLSGSIQRLEGRLGSILVRRGPRGSQLTDLGRVLLPRAKLIVSESERASADFQEIRRQREASVSVGVASIFINDVFPRAAAATLEKMPKVVLRVTEASSLDLMAALRAGEVEMAFGGSPPEGDATGLNFEPVIEQRFLVAARRNHPIFREAKLSDKSVLKYRFVVFDRGFSGDERVAFPWGDLDSVAVASRSSSMEYVRSTILRSDLLGYVADGHVRAELASGAIREVPNAALSYRAGAGILLRDRGAVTAAMRTLRSEFKRACLESPRQ